MQVSIQGHVGTRPEVLILIAEPASKPTEELKQLIQQLSNLHSSLSETCGELEGLASSLASPRQPRQPRNSLNEPGRGFEARSEQRLAELQETSDPAIHGQKTNSRSLKTAVSMVSASRVSGSSADDSLMPLTQHAESNEHQLWPLRWPTANATAQASYIPGSDHGCPAEVLSVRGEAVAGVGENKAATEDEVLAPDFNQLSSQVQETEDGSINADQDRQTSSSNNPAARDPTAEPQLEDSAPEATIMQQDARDVILSPMSANVRPSLARFSGPDTSEEGGIPELHAQIQQHQIALLQKQLLEARSAVSELQHSLSQSESTVQDLRSTTSRDADKMRGLQNQAATAFEDKARNSLEMETLKMELEASEETVASMQADLEAERQLAYTKSAAHSLAQEMAEEHLFGITRTLVRPHAHFVIKFLPSFP